ncbi:MAG: xanthine dehydrogenase family protein molybdopterin-binding subunit [Candidatus Methanomethyliaceae archaeon]
MVYDKLTKILLGECVYADDLEFPNLAHCVFVGSNVAHARIKRLDTSKAEKMPGVIKVLTGKDVLEYMDPLPETSDFGPAGWHWRIPKVYPMAVDKVRFYGEPIAAVVAETEYEAREAANMIEVEYEILPAVVDAREALEPEAPLVYEDWGDNVQVHVQFEWGDVAGAFKSAAKKMKVTWSEGRASGFPLEPRGCVAWYDSSAKELKMWGTYQTPYIAQRCISRTLRMQRSRVKVSAVDIGGAFGNKINCWKDTVVALASILTGRPVKWFENTREFITTGPHQRDVWWEGEVAISEDGLILGIDARFIQDLGVESTNRGAAAMSIVPACAAIVNAYKLKALRVDAWGVVTNKSFFCAYRGYGKDKGVKFMERIMDWVAAELNLDPIEVRRRNFVQSHEFPYRQISGYVYDSGDYEKVILEAVKLVDLEGWRKKKKEFEREGKYIGIGCAFAVEPAGVSVANCVFTGATEARVRINDDGTVEVWSDRTEIGQGADITIANVVAEILGVSLSDILVNYVTSDMVGSGPISSRGAVYPLSAVAKAARELRERIAQFAAFFLSEKPENIAVNESIIYSTRDPTKRMTLKELSQKVYFNPGPRGMPEEIKMRGEMVLDVITSWYSPNTAKNPTSTYTTYCASADMAVVCVDTSTGSVQILKYVHVHDAGRIINKKVIDGQIHGGVVQGIGEALTEEIIYDTSGQLLTGTYADYIMPTACDAPEILVGHLETPSPFTETGAKGMGEAPVIGAKAVIISAVEDALRPLNIRITESPITKERLYTLLKKQNGARRKR